MCSKIEITPFILEELINEKIIGPYNFRKKDSSNFRALIKLEDEGKLKFVFGTGINCPLCGKEFRSNR